MWGGFEAPDWAKALGGPPIETIFNEKPRTVGRFWSPAYRQAWGQLQQQLAARFDRRPLIREVAITSCMSYTAEPFVVPMQDGVLAPLRAAGFTDAAYKECLAHARRGLRALATVAAGAVGQSACARRRGRATATLNSPKASCATAAGRSDGAACSTTTISIPTCRGRSTASTPR